jgi:hypothetical protein
VVEEQHDYQRAASAYLVWPLALAALMREEPAESRWARIHTRQALTLGVLATIGYVVLMAIPLLIVIADTAISTGATEWVYAAGIVADAVAFLGLAICAFSYAVRAGRGELFTIPIVSPIADRIFTLRR